MTDIDHVRRPALDDSGAEDALLAARHLDVQTFFDDVDDLVDHQSHARPSSANTRTGCDPSVLTETPSICISGMS